MGLDMYLRGDKFHWGCVANFRKEDNFRVSNVILELGYWRKHPNLHGYIVETFAKGVDDCQRIDLSGDDIRKIIAAVKAKILPPTTGFFFGRSDGSAEEAARDIAIFEDALKWLEGGDKPAAVMAPPEKLGAGFAVSELLIDPETKPDEGQRVSRDVYYQASW